LRECAETRLASKCEVKPLHPDLLADNPSGTYCTTHVIPCLLSRCSRLETKTDPAKEKANPESFGILDTGGDFCLYYVENEY
jgi:hypothetical protein